jgi:putative ABC transport system permease protein
VLTLPGIAGPLLRLVRALPLRLEGRMAREQLARHQTRTVLTAAVLFVALAVAIAFGQSLRGILCDLRGWYRQSVVADFIVRGAMPDTAFMLAVGLPEKLGGEIAAQAEVAGVEHMAFVPGQGNGQDVLVLARTFAPDRPLPLDLREGAAEAESVRAGLMRGEAVLGEGLARQLGLHRGDAFTLATAQGPRAVRIAGTATEFVAGGSALYLEWEAARRLLHLPGAHVFLVRARPGATERLAPVLRAYCDRHDLLMQSNADLCGFIEGLLGRVTGAIWALMVLVFVVASLGTVNTVRMNIEEQRRTFGVLRAIGLKRGQVYRVVLAQALLLAALSVPPGALAGLGLAYVISAGSSGFAGLPIAFRMDGVIVGGCCALGLMSAVLASLLPARQAARMAVIDALK